MVGDGYFKDPGSLSYIPRKEKYLGSSTVSSKNSRSHAWSRIGTKLLGSVQDSPNSKFQRILE